MFEIDFGAAQQESFSDVVDLVSTGDHESTVTGVVDGIDISAERDETIDDGNVLFDRDIVSLWIVNGPFHDR